MVTCSPCARDAANAVVFASEDCTSPRVAREVMSMLRTRLVTGKFRSDPWISVVASGMGCNSPFHEEQLARLPVAQLSRGLRR